MLALRSAANSFWFDKRFGLDWVQKTFEKEAKRGNEFGFDWVQRPLG